MRKKKETRPVAKSKRKPAEPPTLVSLVEARNALNVQIKQMRDAMPNYDIKPVIEDGQAHPVSVIERVAEKAARNCNSLDFAGPLERLVWDVMSPGCSSNEKNVLAFLALISFLNVAAPLASVNDWDLLCSEMKRYIVHWSEESIDLLLDAIRELEQTLKSEVEP